IAIPSIIDAAKVRLLEPEFPQNRLYGRRMRSRHFGVAVAREAVVQVRESERLDRSRHAGRVIDALDNRFGALDLIARLLKRNGRESRVVVTVIADDVPFPDRLDG